MNIPCCRYLLFPLLLTSSGHTSDLSGQAAAILEEIWTFHPITATHLGIHDYDTLMPDYSGNSRGLRAKRFKELREQLQKVDTLGLSVDDLVDYYLLMSLLNDEIFDLEVRNVYEQNPLIYVQACINSVYSIMIRHSASPQTRMRAISERLKKIPGFLETARQNLKDPPYILCEVGIEQLTEGEKFIDGVFESFRDSLPEPESDGFRQAKIAAVAAMMRFAYWLEGNQKKNKQYSLGEENYNYKLKNIHYVDITADSILKIGEYYLTRSGTIIDSLSQLLTSSPGQRVTLPPDFGKKDVENYRRDEIRNLRNYVKEANIVTIPDWVGSIEIVETPRFMSALIPGLAMMPPGPFDASDTSLFFVPPVPANFDLAEAEYYYNYIHNRWFLSGAVHEAYPGHHLQLSIANKQSSAVRRAFQDLFFVEGWAMYCEEMMARSGLYDDTIGAVINALEGVRYRAARIILDVKLQTGVFDYDDALRFMVDTFGGNEDYYAREIKRYISTPIQPSSYLIGKIQLLELREEYKRLKGIAWNQTDFHDKLISHGSIPVKLVRKLMIDSHN
jgi:uncharacterized protein (DUF885 family)